MKWAKIAMAALVGLATATAVGAWASETKVTRLSSVVFTPTEDEQTLEKHIAAFLREHKGLYVLEAMLPGSQDLVLRIPFGDEATGRRTFTIVIDTSVSARDPSLVTERAIVLRLIPAVQPCYGDRRRAAEVARVMQLKIWGPQFVVDGEGNVALHWALNVLPVGLPAEYVVDAMQRMAMDWHDFEKALKRSISSPTTERSPRYPRRNQRQDSVKAVSPRETVAICLAARP